MRTMDNVLGVAYVEQRLHLQPLVLVFRISLKRNRRDYRLDKAGFGRAWKSRS
jgi:hypothetical protein